MKSIIKVFALCALLVSAHGARAQVTVKVDSSSNWIGWMNVFELPENGGGYLWGSAWGTPDLAASFNGPVLTLSPNTNLFTSDPPPNPYWWKPDGTGNKTMDANFYVEDSTTLPGQTVTFTGKVLSNTLVAPYTAVAFIKDFAPDYSSNNGITAWLYEGEFTITLETLAGHHIQYGFTVNGPNARGDENPPLGDVKIEAISTGPGPFTLAEAVSALKIWGGLQEAQTADVARLHHGTGTGIDLSDVVSIMRKVAGTDTNP